MHSDSLAPWQKPHSFLADRHGANARRTMIVLVLTVVTMIAEIAAGSLFGSMALLADGWHMGSHAAALGIAAFAYAYARRHAENSVYTFGTGKVGDLAAFASALLLVMIAVLMAYESALRLMNPVAIAYNEAIAVAVVGLIVNFVSAWILKDTGHDHDHGHAHGDDHEQYVYVADTEGHAHHAHTDHGHTGHGHTGHGHAGHGHHEHHQDHNIRAAYVHVLTDALTSVFAIVALVAGLFWGVAWLDAVMGIVGAAIIIQWAWGLLRTTSRVLLDAAPSGNTTLAVKKAIEAESDNRIADLHVWRVGPGHLAAVVTVVTHHARTPAHYKKLLTGIPNLSHVTVEVETCCDQQPHAA